MINQKFRIEQIHFRVYLYLLFHYSIHFFIFVSISKKFPFPNFISLYRNYQSKFLKLLQEDSDVTDDKYNITWNTRLPDRTVSK